MSACPAPLPVGVERSRAEALDLHLVEQSVTSSAAVTVSFKTRLVGFLRRLSRDVTHPDADDMTPEHIMACQEALHHTVERFDSADARQRQAALEACVPLLFNMRVLSARLHFARELVALCPEFAARPETFMQHLMNQVEAYGRGFAPRFALEFIIVE